MFRNLRIPRLGVKSFIILVFAQLCFCAWGQVEDFWMQNAPRKMIFYNCERRGRLEAPPIAFLGAQNTPGDHQAAAYAPNLTQTGTQVAAKRCRNITKLNYGCIFEYIFAASMSKGSPARILGAGGSHWDGKEDVWTAQA